METPVLFFTSVSEKKSSRRTHLVKACVFSSAVFLIFMGVSQWIRIQRPQWVYHSLLTNPNWDQALVNGAFDTPNDVSVFYHGIGPAMAYARQAQVLILGNSRPYFAFRASLLDWAEKQSGLKIYSLAGPGSTFVFTEELIRRQNLNPRILILNEDDFFNPVLWPTQKEVLAESDWQAWTRLWERRVSWEVSSGLQRWIPKFIFFKEHEGKIPLLIRSVQNGGLLSENFSEESFPLEESRSFDLKLDPLYLERAKAFKKEMEEHGITLILTHVPSDGRGAALTQAVAGELGVVCLIPHLKGLETFDHSHLTPESGDRFAKAFFEELFQLPEMKKLLR